MKLPDITLIVMMLFASCQKDISQEPNSPMSITDKDGMLSKLVVTSLPDNNDVLSYEFFYDDAFRISSIVSVFKKPAGAAIQLNEIFSRDNLGRVSYIRSGPESEYYSKFNYLGTTHKLQSGCLYLKAGDVLVDSMVYEYDDERITKTSQYLRQAGGNLSLHGYQIYSYDGNGNIIQKQLYQAESMGVFLPSLKYQWEYDSKPNPKFFDDPALFYWSHNWPSFGSPSNVIKQKNYYPTGNDDEFSYLINYYTDGRPLTEIKNPGSTSITKYFYY